MRMLDREKPPYVGNDPGNPRAIVGTYKPGTIKVLPMPLGDDLKNLTLTCALTSEDLNCNVPEFVQTHFYDTILSGCLGRMYSHPKRPYSAPSIAVEYKRRFRSGMAEARDMGRRNFTAANSSWQFPAWA